MPTIPPEKAAELPAERSIVLDDPFYRVQRAMGLIPTLDTLGVARRTLFFVLITWVPIVAWAAMRGRVMIGAADEPLLHHFGIHVRLLVALPALILGELIAHRLWVRLIPLFRSSGVVPDRSADAFDAILRRALRLRRRLGPYLVILAVVMVLSISGVGGAGFHEVIWATSSDLSGTAIGFGGLWSLYVARPIFLWFLLLWCWRLIQTSLLLYRISRLDLDFVPTHPDQAGGLGFVEDFPIAYCCVTFAGSAVVASQWAHEVVYHGVELQSLITKGAFLVVSVMLLALSPLLVFLPAMGLARRQARFDYGTLVAHHGRLVRHRWILGERIGDEDILKASELGPVVDISSMYQLVSGMRIAPIGRRAILLVAIPTLVPMLGVVLIRIPLKDLLLDILKTLV